MSKLEQYIEQALVGKSEKTIRTYRAQLEAFNEYLEQSGTSLDKPLARVDVQQYVTYLTNLGRKASTVNLAYNAIRGFAKWSEQRAAVDNIRVVKQTPILHRTPKSLEKNERNRLLRLVEQPARSAT